MGNEDPPSNISSEFLPSLLAFAFIPKVGTLTSVDSVVLCFLERKREVSFCAKLNGADASLSVHLRGVMALET